MEGLVFCFFSSRRRHTRCSRDWSSDVCSSDLPWRCAGYRSGGLFLARPRRFRVKMAGGDVRAGSRRQRCGSRGFLSWGYFTMKWSAPHHEKQKTSEPKPRKFSITNYQSTNLPPSPTCPILAIFDRDSQFLEPVTDQVRKCPKFLLARLATHLDQQIDEFVGVAGA